MPPACTGWSASPADILVAVAGSFKHDGDIDVLLARIGAISAKSNVRYWSTTEKRWQPLVTEAFALSGPDAAQRREDFAPAQFVKGQTLHYAQSDNRSSGKTVYRERVLSVDRDRLAVVSENLTPVKMTLITLFDAGDMQTAYFVERRSPGVWNFYSLTRTRMASSLMPIGSDALLHQPRGGLLPAGGGDPHRPGAAGRALNRVRRRASCRGSRPARGATGAPAPAGRPPGSAHRTPPGRCTASRRGRSR